MKRYVWLNIATGEFSNSWTEKEYSRENSIKILDSLLHSNEWKLIEYECLSDNEFKFNNQMVIK